MYRVCFGESHMSFDGRRTLTGGGGESATKGVIAVIKNIRKAPDCNERTVKVQFEDDNRYGAIYVPAKYAKNLKPERKYEFHLQESSFRGGGQSRFSGSEMIRRTKLAPIETKASGLNGGRAGEGAGKFNNRWK